MIKIGWAAADVSTNEPVNIPGQMHIRISKGVADPVMVTVLAVEGDEDSAIFVSADRVGIRDRVYDDIRSQLNEKAPQVPADKILMNATHTHCCPSTADTDAELGDGEQLMPLNGIKLADGAEYRRFFIDSTVDAIIKAWESRKSGGIGYGYGYAVVGHSRRTVYFDDVSLRENKGNDADYCDGECSTPMGGNPAFDSLSVNGHTVMYGETDDEKFSHYEAGADHFLNIMFTFDDNDKLTGAIINVPCPSQSSELEYKLTGDYWSDVRRLIHEKYGDIYVLPQCAAAGDLSPRILHYKKAQDRRFRLKYGDEMTRNHAERRDIAERIVTGFDEILGWASKDIKKDLPVRHSVRTIQLERRNVTDEEYEENLNCYNKLREMGYESEGDPRELLLRNSLVHAAKARSVRVLKLRELCEKEPEFPMELHVIRVGDIAFASNSFELYMDYEHRIQARSPFEQTFIVQLSGIPGDVSGTYLPTERAMRGRGYGACVYDMTVTPAGGQTIVEETVKDLKKLYNS